MIYKAYNRHVIEYCSHIWGSAPKYTLVLLDTIQIKGIRQVDVVKLTSFFDIFETLQKSWWPFTPW